MVNKFVSNFEIKIGGSTIPPEMSNDLIEIVVEDNHHLPDSFSIELYDPEMKWMNDSTLSVGAPVEISAKAPSERESASQKSETLICGEITNLEPDLGLSGKPSMTIRGYDLSYRLHQGSQTRSFLQMTDDEIVQQIAGEVQLSPQTDSTGVLHEQVTQNNQTNMEFIKERAKRIGFQVSVEEKKLYFTQKDAEQSTGENPPVMEWGVNLINFQPQLSAVNQVKQVEVRGWDMMTKREIVSQVADSQSAPDVSGKSEGDKAFAGTGKLVISRPVKTQEEADKMAQAIRDEMASDLIQAEGSGVGDPRVKAGKKLQLKGLGSRFDGTYFVTLVTHTYNSEQGYETAFSIGGHKPKTLSSLLGEQNQHDKDPGRGVMVGLVTNNNDPQDLGRVKVQLPGLDSQDESSWARIAAPMAGEQRGFYYIPEVNDEVLVSFEQGDIHRPYILGGLWNGQDKPPKPNSEVVGGGGKVNQRILQSRTGHVIILDDTQGKEKITIQDKTEGNFIEIDSAANSMMIKVAGNLTIEAGGIITIKGKSIELN